MMFPILLQYFVYFFISSLYQFFISSFNMNVPIITVYFKKTPLFIFWWPLLYPFSIPYRSLFWFWHLLIFSGQLLVWSVSSFLRIYFFLFLWVSIVISDLWNSFILEDPVLSHSNTNNKIFQIHQHFI